VPTAAFRAWQQGGRPNNVAAVNRNHALDTLRGLLLLVIAINHFSGPIPMITYQPFGYVTGAEGFVLISGIAMGLLGQKFATAGRGNFSSWCRRRSLTIYGYHLVVVIAILALAGAGEPFTAFCVKNMPELADQPWRKLPAAFALLYQPRYNAILPLYCLLLLIAPLVLASLRRFGPARVLIVSLSIWGLIQGFWSEQRVYEISDQFGWRLGIKNPFAWQALFVLGLVAGTKPTWFTARLQRVSGFGTAAILLLVIALKVTHSLHSDILGIPNLAAATDGDTLGWLRLLNTLLVAYLIWCLLVRLPPIGPNPVAFLGRHSLPVFAGQILLLYLFRPFFDKTNDPAWLLAIGSLLLSASQFGPAFLHARWQAWRRVAPLS
jgi:hypothetical protein